MAENLATVEPAASQELSALSGVVWAARISMRQFLTGPRKWVILLAGALFPGLMSLFVFVAKEGWLHPFLQLFDELYLQGILLFIALLGATPGFSSDVEDATIVYLFSRPTPRWQILLGKWLGVMIPLVALGLLPVLAAWPFAMKQVQSYEKTIYVPVVEDAAKPGPDVGERRPSGATAIPKMVRTTRTFQSQRMKARGQDLCMALLSTVMGLMVYGTLFFTIGVFTSYPYVVALCYGVIVEVLVGRVNVRFHVLSKFIRSIAVRMLEPTPSFFRGFLEIAPSASMSVIALILVPSICLGFSCLIVSKKSYVSKGI